MFIPSHLNLRFISIKDDDLLNDEAYVPVYGTVDEVIDDFVVVNCEDEAHTVSSLNLPFKFIKGDKVRRTSEQQLTRLLLTLVDVFILKGSLIWFLEGGKFRNEQDARSGVHPPVWL